eukprot:gnl/Trimastix_PCT/1656.p1 GENE.gnl/Trimastix_PCT/1656~~gnl/Trimastix_PCT/1656.p1  ORF type:complete len:956 (-),score=237.75 gnl/Trimastix_PCT/1656:143-3010(-)
MKICLPALALLFLICAHTCVATGECAADQYFAVYTPCANNQRNATYYTTAPCNPPPSATVNCECTRYDYTAQFGECQVATHTRSKTYTKSTDCHDGMSLPAAETVPCNCDPQDLKFTFGLCDGETGTRQLVYYYPYVCSGSPPPVRHVPCDFHCEPGTHLDMATGTCQSCSAGEFSLGGGVAHTEWPRIPEGFTTRCTGTGCSPWVASGTMLTSGNQTTTGTVKSILETSVQVIAAGSFVRFSFTVDAEACCDGLSFYVDGTRVMKRHGVETRWVEKQFPLTIGAHNLTWVYEKDYAISRGEDAAFIRTVHISGLNYADKECTKCPPGSSSGERSATCTKCPRNTHAATAGSPTCEPCPADAYSYTGSLTCTARVPCTEDDYEALYDPCIGGRRREYFQWMEPMICNNASGVRLPAPRPDQPCAPCNPGFERSAGDQMCHACPAGQYRAGNMAVCGVCAAGHEAPPALSLQYFDHWDPHVATGCDGDMCGTSGWRLRDSFIDSGKAHRGMVDSWLTVTVDLTVHGHYEFRYHLELQRSTRLLFYVDGHPRYLSQSSGMHNYRSYQALDPGHHVFKWVLSKTQYQEGEGTDQAQLHGLVVRGVQNGGAVDCSICPAGEAAPEGSIECSVCSPGTHTATEGMAQCMTCPNNTFADMPHAHECLACGAGTTTPAGSGDCGYGCVFQPDATTRYDLSALSRDDEMYGPVYDADDAHKYYLNICSKRHLNHSCHDDQGRPIPAFACQITYHGNGMDLGNQMAYLPLTSDPRGGLHIQYFHGTECAHGVNRITNVTMLCDHDAGAGFPVWESESPRCVYNFLWRSMYACRECRDEDFTISPGACVASKRKMTEVFREPRMCHGGRGPKPVWEEACVMEVHFPFWVLIIVGVVFLAVAVIIIFLVKKTRSLKYNFQKLQDMSTSFAGAEMTTTACVDGDLEGAGDYEMRAMGSINDDAHDRV